MVPHEVQVLEQLDGPGGRAYVFAQDGYTFDAGPTIITAPFLLEELWALCGRRLQDDVDLRLMEPFYRIRFDDGRIFDYNANDEQMERQIATFDARDVKGFRRLVEVAERCRRIGFEGMGSIAFDRFMDLIKALPGFARMQAWRTIYGVVAKHLRHPQLRIAFSFHTLLIGGNPFSVTSAYALIHSLERRWGVHSVMGGTGALVRAMVKLLQQRGVAIRYQARVAEITVESGRATGVRLANGETLAADIVVSNADSAWTYKHLVRREHRRHWSDSRIERGRYSMGLFVWYFGTKRRYEEVPHHMMVLGPRYKGLLRDIFKRKYLADDFSLYLH
ncbi:MAG: phytoene desaturase family protein, partial [Burkholderiaceae bacterium]